MSTYIKIQIEDDKTAALFWQRLEDMIDAKRVGDIEAEDARDELSSLLNARHVAVAVEDEDGTMLIATRTEDGELLDFGGVYDDWQRRED